MELKNDPKEVFIHETLDTDENLLLTKKKEEKKAPKLINEVKSED